MNQLWLWSRKMLWQCVWAHWGVCVCVSAVWSFISTKWQINHSVATVGLCSLSVWTINLRNNPHLPLLCYIRQGCGCDAQKYFNKNILKNTNKSRLSVMCLGFCSSVAWKAGWGRQMTFPTISHHELELGISMLYFPAFPVPCHQFGH